MIRFSILRSHIPEKLRHEVAIHATAVVYSNDSEYLLEVVESCGIDYNEAGSEEMDGMQEAKKKKKKIEEYAELEGLILLPGVIGI